MQNRRYNLTTTHLYQEMFKYKLNASELTSTWRESPTMYGPAWASLVFVVNGVTRYPHSGK